MNNKIALITGANRGIGLEACKQLLSAGFYVIMGSRDLEKGLEIFKREFHGESNIVCRELDVLNENTILGLKMWIEKEFGKLDVLVNNAGIMFGNSSLIDPAISNIKSIMEVNFYGPILMNKHLIPLLMKSENGKIINVSSGMGLLNELGTGHAGYRLSKAGLNAQTILLSNELKSTNIKVYAISPGWVKTDMGGDSAPLNVEQGADTITWLAENDHIPDGRFYRDRKEIPW